MSDSAPTDLELEGLTPKAAWWAGYRAGKGLAPETPRYAALAALSEADADRIAEYERLVARAIAKSWVGALMELAKSLAELPQEPPQDKELP